MKKILLVIAVLMVTSLGLSAQVKFTVCTYNVKSFEGADNAPKFFDMPPFIEALKPLNLDIIVLNELEILTSRTGPKDLGAVLGNGLGMYTAFGRAYDKDDGLYGNGILSRFPILNTFGRQIVKPADSSDQRGVLFADILHTSGQIFRIVALHLDHRAGRKEQIQDILSDTHITNSPYPIILMGDFNIWYYPFEVPMTNFKLLSDPHKPTFEGMSTLDYIFAAPANQWTVHSSSVKYDIKHSDHSPVVCEIEWKK